MYSLRARDSLAEYRNYILILINPVRLGAGLLHGNNPYLPNSAIVVIYIIKLLCVHKKCRTPVMLCKSRR